MRTRLLSGLVDAPLDGEILTVPDQGVRYTRPALLVYEGRFDSMDGEVIVTKAQLLKLVAKENARLDHACRLAACSVEGLPPKEYVPLQLDHSTAATHTVGRVTSRLKLGPYIRKDGSEVLGVYGDVTFLGVENCEKAKDGRYTHLSVGADFDEGVLTELTVTPFSAAPEASLLSRLSAGNPVKTVVYKGVTIKVYEDQGGFVAIFGNYHDCVGSSPEEAADKAKQVIDANRKRFSKGDTMPTPEEKERLKKHLMKKMSDEEAEKHLAKCSEDDTEMKKLSAEVDEDEKKMAAEDDENKKKLAAEEDEKKRLAAEEDDKKAKLAAEDADKQAKEDEEKKELKKKKLSAAKENITRLSGAFTASRTGAKLAASKGMILTRLSKLRGDAKITPAEIKKMDIDKLSAGDPKTIDAVLKSYEDREPVIAVGQLGSIKAEELAKLSKGVRMSKLEEETRANMSLLKGTVKEGTKHLSAHQMTPVTPEVEAITAQEVEVEFGEITKLMDGGKLDEAKTKIKGAMLKRLSYGSQSGAHLSNDEIEKQISALAESANTMQTQFEELTQLAESLVGE